jgi:hypothetical protein
MLELVISIILNVILLVILILALRDGKSKNYLIKSLRETNNQLSVELEKRKGE